MLSPLHLKVGAQMEEYQELLGALAANPDRAIVRQTTIRRKDGSDIPVEKTYHSAPPGRDGSRWIITLARGCSARLTAEANLLRSRDALREAEQVVMIADDRERIARDLTG